MRSGDGAGPRAEMGEAGPATNPFRLGTHSCSSLIRLEQERKRQSLEKQQKLRKASTQMADKKESSDALDLAEYTKKQPWWRKLFASPSGSNTEKYSVVTQLTIGGGIGWCTGFIFQKVGKLAATAVGGGFFLLQIASQTGYIKVDWRQVEQDVNRATEQLTFHGSSTSHLVPEVQSKVDEFVLFLKKNVVLAGGFVGGFLLGMSS